jgi:4-hydroxybenzoate polyprenyltransferase
LTIAIWYNFINFLIGWVVFKPAQTAPYALLFLLFFYDIIAINSKDYPDVEGDRQYGAKTLPVLIGIEKALRLDLIIQVGVQASFILLALNGNIPQYMAIMGGFLLLSTSIMFYYVEKTREYMNFYYMAFAMHVVMRIAVVVLFFLGHLKSTSIGSELQRSIEIVKMRNSKIKGGVYSFDFGKNGISILE